MAGPENWQRPLPILMEKEVFGGGINTGIKLIFGFWKSSSPISKFHPKKGLWLAE
jgi:hypothetical protein